MENDAVGESTIGGTPCGTSSAEQLGAAVNALLGGRLTFLVVWAKRELFRLVFSVWDRELPSYDHGAKRDARVDTTRGQAREGSLSEEGSLSSDKRGSAQGNPRHHSAHQRVPGSLLV